MKRSILLAALLCACGGTPPTPERSLTLAAAPDALLSENGTHPSAVLRAFLVEDDVPTRVEPTRWVLVTPGLGAIDDEGRFVASGARGGVVRVAAELELDGETLRAETALTVRVRRDVVASPGLSPSIVASFESATPVDDPRAAPFLRYPLDGARVPNDLAPPSIQWDDDWDSSGQQDPIRVTLRSPYAEVHGYLDGSQIEGEWSVDAASWSLLARSSGGETIEIEAARLGRDTVAPGNRVSIQMSERALGLAMIAWELSIDPQRSRLVDLDLASSDAGTVMDLGATECAGCHSVALEGDRFAATIDRLYTGLFDADGELVAAIEPPLDAVAFQPGGALLIGSREVEGASALFAFDRASGEAMDVALPTDAGFAAWSPDGSALAYVIGGSDAATGTRGPTSIARAEWDGSALGAPATLHEGSELSAMPEGGETDSHPTFSPDGALLAFAHGTSSHAIADGSTPASSALYVLRDGEAVRLERAMGPEGDGLAFWPVFAPRATIEGDGTRTYWLAFYSRMPYGNERAGTRGSPRRQLWVAAIDPAITEGDPSFAPFRVASQRVDRDQLAGAWRALSCGGESASCRVDSQCCSGVCEEGACGPALECRPLGASCDEASPCCESLTCEAGQCSEDVE